MELSDSRAVDALVQNLLMPGGDAANIRWTADAKFIGPMVQHLDRDEVVHFLNENFVSTLTEPLPLIERTDGDTFSTLTILRQPPDGDPEPDKVHFVVEVANGQVAALRMAFNVHRWPTDATERIRRTAEEWRARHS